MTCINPLDGIPRRALMSVTLIARGLPPDSRCIRDSNEPIHDAGSCAAARAAKATVRHRCTPAPPPGVDVMGGSSLFIHASAAFFEANGSCVMMSMRAGRGPRPRAGPPRAMPGMIVAVPSLIEAIALSPYFCADAALTTYSLLLRGN